ncbi:carboxypeptidase-like regulatory domain-containing protein [Haloarcula laminariae]|uniref:carboxypeptidase-like regulatory domain-containing protein n=1 Tax=Haloarcula laminariae TaxID=2961577 RepID=UPI00240735DB|nr:carboxypeptidase-like regulatory domain-containing protein [Halomicroarcula sp. FL173]
MHTRLFAVMATMGLVLFALGPGAATVAADTAGNDALDVAVDQTDAEPTVTVTDNGTAVENATVTVEALDNGTYEGTSGSYSTDANGTATLPEPTENVSVEVTATAEGATGSTTADLTVSAGNESVGFGAQVSAFVESLLAGNTTGVGQQVADYVTENNPGNAPAWAGPPVDDDKRGPPEHAGGNDNETEGDKRGPPEHAGPSEDSDDADDNETEGDERGPPEHAGPSEDSDDADDNEIEDDDSETEDDDSGGPPEQARGNGN